MNGKLSNISKWVFGALALITVVLGVIFYLDLHNEARTSLILNWGYILIILGIVTIICSAIVAAIVFAKMSLYVVGALIGLLIVLIVFIFKRRKKQ